MHPETQELIDAELLRRWEAYHAKHAQLQLLCHTCHEEKDSAIFSRKEQDPKNAEHVALLMTLKCAGTCQPCRPYSVA